MKAFNFMKWFFAVVGILLLLGAGWLYFDVQEFLVTSKTADGEVIELARQESHGDSSDTYAPVIRLRTEEGTSIQFTSDISSNPPSYSVGEHVPVVYSPAKPSRAKINSFWGLYFGVFIAGLLGLVFFIIGAGGVIYKRYRTRDIDWLRQNGQRVQADVIEVSLNTAYAVNDQHPYQIRAQWFDPRANIMRVFKSDKKEQGRRNKERRNKDTQELAFSRKLFLLLGDYYNRGSIARHRSSNYDRTTERNLYC